MDPEKHLSWPFEPRSSSTAHHPSENTAVFALISGGVSGCLQKMPLPPSTDSPVVRFVHQGAPSHTHSTFKAAYNTSLV